MDGIFILYRKGVMNIFLVESIGGVHTTSFSEGFEPCVFIKLLDLAIVKDK